MCVDLLREKKQKQSHSFVLTVCDAVSGVSVNKMGSYRQRLNLHINLVQLLPPDLNAPWELTS